MFIDTAKIFIQAGKGGDGAVSFRHEIYVPKGGPDGGNGGKGGDVVFVASKDENTLTDFRFQPRLIADDGRPGSGSRSTGKSGQDLIVKVPVGTIVKKSGDILADLTLDQESVIIAHGGNGGHGNAHYKSSTNRSPKTAQRGATGESFEAELELKLLADVGLIGLPNAGKSTLLSVVSNAQPEIADYPFTTLTPNLGVATIDNADILIADIPGLIEGAARGKGLGNAFLRHIERTTVLLHLIDVYNENVATAYTTIRQELEAHNLALTKRPEIVALTKTEGIDKELLAHQINSLKKITKSDIYAISSQAHSGLKQLLRALNQKIKQPQLKAEEEQAPPTIPIIT
jgi:GTP-binding protein